MKTETILLLDADIRLEPGTIPALQARMQQHDLHLVSLLAFLRMDSFWEKLLMPAFVYFFKLLYPFHLSNKGSRTVAAAAGGCILLRSASLEQAGGFKAIKNSLIDDCALARQFRHAGFATWIGLSHSARSRRRYDGLSGIWNMVARTAYIQLRYSFVLLVLCSFLLTAGFVLPLAGLFCTDPVTRLLAVTGIFLMAASYLPTLRYYAIHPLWCATFPLAGALYPADDLEFRLALLERRRRRLENSAVMPVHPGGWNEDSRLRQSAGNHVPPFPRKRESSQKHYSLRL